MKTSWLVAAGIVISLIGLYFTVCFLNPQFCFRYGLWKFQVQWHVRKSPALIIDYTVMVDSRPPRFYNPGDPIVWTIESVLASPASRHEANLRAILTGGVSELVDMRDRANVEKAAAILRNGLGRYGVEFDEELNCALDEITLRPQ
jgi:hypothetical protein